MEKQVTTIKKALAQLDTCCGKISNQRAATKDNIHATFSRLQEVLNVRETELISQLDQVTQGNNPHDNCDSQLQHDLNDNLKKENKIKWYGCYLLSRAFVLFLLLTMCIPCGYVEILTTKTLALGSTQGRWSYGLILSTRDINHTRIATSAEDVVLFRNRRISGLRVMDPSLEESSKEGVTSVPATVFAQLDNKEILEKETIDDSRNFLFISNMRLVSDYQCVLGIVDPRDDQNTNSQDLDLSLTLYKAPRFLEGQNVLRGINITFTSAVVGVVRDHRYDTHQSDGEMRTVSSLTIFNITGSDSDIVECFTEYIVNVGVLVSPVRSKTVLDEVNFYQPIPLQSCGFIFPIILKHEGAMFRSENVFSWSSGPVVITIVFGSVLVILILIMVLIIIILTLHRRKICCRLNTDINGDSNYQAFNNNRSCCCVKLSPNIHTSILPHPKLFPNNRTKDGNRFRTVQSAAHKAKPDGDKIVTESKKKFGDREDSVITVALNPTGTGELQIGTANQHKI